MMILNNIITVIGNYLAIVYENIIIFFRNFLQMQDPLVWGYLISLYIIFTILEYFFPIRATRGPYESFKDEIGFFVGNKLTNFITAAIIAPLIEIASLHPLIPHLNEQPMILQFVIVIVLSEFIYYWYHRMLHRVGWLWEIHRIHHSIEDINAINGNFRYHVFEVIFNYSITYAPILLFGFSKEVMYTYLFLQIFINTLAHCNVNFNYGRLNNWLVTTQVHQFHHDADPPVSTGVNYGNMFTICDKIFNSFFIPSNQYYPQRLGLRKGSKEGNYPYPVKGYFKQQLYPLRKFLPKTFYKQADNLMPYTKPKNIPVNLREKFINGETIAPTISGELYPNVKYGESTSLSAKK